MYNLSLKLKRYPAFAGVLLGLTGSFFGLSGAEASFFTTPHFVPQDKYSIGAEPEGVFTQGGSFGINLRYTHGLSELSNLIGILGAGSGSKGFRLGGAMTFDVFPDVGKQIGIGFGGQGLLVQRVSVMAVEITGFAYMHKNIALQSDYATSWEPFLAIPLGLELAGGSYQGISSVSLGSIFTHSSHLKSVLELSVGLSVMDTSISGGIAYYP